MNKIFLAASVPSSNSSFYADCDPMLIQAALRTFLYTVLGRKHLVFGGHPTISPLILAVCEDLGVDNKAAVTIYQSEYFKKIAPKVNARFANLTSVKAGNTRESSLENMRKEMFRRPDYESAVFIGGQQGIIDEYELLKISSPNTKIIALHSPGGASASIASMEARSPKQPLSRSAGKDYDELMDYVGLFAKGLNIDLNSERILAPERPKPKRKPENPFLLG